MSGSLREFGLALASLFRSGSEGVWFPLLASLLLQALWWSQVSGVVNDPLTAGWRVGWTVLLLLLVPLLLTRLLRAGAADVGLQLGDAGFGLRLTVIAVPLTVLIAWFASADPAFQAEYPWPGTSVAGSPLLLLIWFAVYAGYYLAYEFFYRGFLFGLLSRHWGPHSAIWLQTVASALVHLGKPFPELIAAIPAGLLFGVIAWRSRSILWPFLIHLSLGIATDLFSLLRQGAFQ